MSDVCIIKKANFGPPSVLDRGVEKWLGGHFRPPSVLDRGVEKRPPKTNCHEGRGPREVSCPVCSQVCFASASAFLRWVIFRTNEAKQTLTRTCLTRPRASNCASSRRAQLMARRMDSRPISWCSASSCNAMAAARKERPVLLGSGCTGNTPDRNELQLKIRGCKCRARKNTTCKFRGGE